MHKLGALYMSILFYCIILVFRLTAYMEFEIMKAKKGETFFVNASAGAVGSIVGQMAKAKGWYF